LVLVARCSTTARLHHSIAPFEHGAGLAIASRSGFSSTPNTPVTNACQIPGPGEGAFGFF
jgi:hypothetical protein